MAKKNPAVERFKKTRTIRFRVTEDEWDTIGWAASYDQLEIKALAHTRGLAGDFGNIDSPSEWCRQIVLLAAKQKHEELGAKTPIEKRRDGEPVR